MVRSISHRPLALAAASPTLRFATSKLLALATPLATPLSSSSMSAGSALSALGCRARWTILAISTKAWDALLDAALATMEQRAISQIQIAQVRAPSATFVPRVQVDRYRAARGASTQNNMALVKSAA